MERGNVYDSGVVGITGKPYRSAFFGYGPRNVVNFDNSSYFWSINQPNQSLTFDFKERRVALSAYALATGDKDCHLTSWALEGSNDGANWIVIDEHHNDSVLWEARRGLFELQRPPVPYRFIRLRQIHSAFKRGVTGDFWGYGPHVLYLSGFEIFGSVYPPIFSSME